MADNPNEVNVELNINDLEIVQDAPYLKITSKEILDKVKELKGAAGLEGGVGIGVVWSKAAKA